MATSFRRQRRESLRTRLSTWPMKITSFSLNNFAPEEFFGGAKSVSMNAPKFSNATALWRRSPLPNAIKSIAGSHYFINPLPVLITLKILWEILSFTRLFMINTRPFFGCLENSTEKWKNSVLYYRLLQVVLFTIRRYNVLYLNVSGSVVRLLICIAKLSSKRHCANLNRLAQMPFKSPSVINLVYSYKANQTRFEYSEQFPWSYQHGLFFAFSPPPSIDITYNNIFTTNGAQDVLKTRTCYIFSLYLWSHFRIRIIVLTCPDDKSARNHQPKSWVPAKSHKSQWC